MAVTRRGFMGAIAAALVLDPERALWVPGKKLISIPKPAANPLWLFAHLEFPDDPAYVMAVAEHLIDNWKRRETRDGVTLLPTRLVMPRGVERAEAITIGRFPLRLVKVFDPVYGRMYARLDMATDEAFDRALRRRV